jgi:hypothetical protein
VPAQFLNAAAPGLILPRGEQYWTSPDMYDYTYAKPSYTRSEAAMMFFGRSARWLKAHILDANTEIIEGLELARDGRGRKYKLFHIEVIAHGLVQRRIIDGRQFLDVIAMLKLQACLWGYRSQIEALERRASREREL